MADANMNLDNSQKAKVTGWIAEGLKLADIQKRIATEFQQTLTYMEVRFLVDDLKLTPKDPTPPPAPALPVPPSAPPAAAAVPAPSLLGETTVPGASKVSVTVSALPLPGTLVSGEVTFSDGNKASWHMDQSGRLGVASNTPGYKPSAADVQAFQLELDKELSKLGL